MQQVQSVGFRLGSTTGGNSNQYKKDNSAIITQFTPTLRKLLSRKGAFLLNNYEYNHREILFCVVLFYQYYQRSRIPKGMVKLLRKREAALAPIQTRNYILNRLDLGGRNTRIERKLGGKNVFPKPGIKGFSKLAKKSQKIRGWADLEYCFIRVMKRWPANHLNNLLRSHTHLGRSSTWARTEGRAYNILDFVEASNPLKATRHFVFKKFGRMLYQHDIVESIFLAANLNMSKLIAHTIVLGLERHGRRRQQLRFLKSVKSIIAHILSGNQIAQQSVGRISVFGKLDAKMRRTHFKMKVGFIRYQQVDFVTSYTQDVSKTRFGTSAVRVGMRNLLK